MIAATIPSTLLAEFFLLTFWFSAESSSIATLVIIHRKIGLPP